MNSMLPDHLLIVGPFAPVESEIANPREPVFEILEAVLEAQVALAVWAVDRVDVGLGEEVEGRDACMHSMLCSGVAK